MKVECTSKGRYAYLVVGKVYEVVSVDGGTYEIYPHDEYPQDTYKYEKYLFMIVQEDVISQTTLKVNIEATAALQQVKELTEALTALDVTYSKVKHLLNFKGE